MADHETGELSQKTFESGIFRLETSKSFFIDPVRVLNRNYTRYRVCPSAYYSRFLGSKQPDKPSCVSLRKRKRKNKKGVHPLNEREQAADRRHREARPWLVSAHDSFLKVADPLLAIPDCRVGDFCREHDLLSPSARQSFIDLGKVWQASLYAITLNICPHDWPRHDGGASVVQCTEQRVVPLFDNIIFNETKDDVEAEFFSRQYIIPRESCFYMSDLKQLRMLIPGSPDSGFNLIVVDPPWENSSAHQKSMYPTLPNRYFLSLPIKQLTHTDGALVALWVTHREKFWNFVEKELFPAWGVTHMATFYWLKVRPDGSLLCDLDLFHHRPYECLLLGYCIPEVVDSKSLSNFKPIQDNQVIISIPGEYSRKPPIEDSVGEYVPGLKPRRCIELFARELIGGWTSWGHEPLRFQDHKLMLNG